MYLGHMPFLYRREGSVSRSSFNPRKMQRAAFLWADSNLQVGFTRVCRGGMLFRKKKKPWKNIAIGVGHLKRGGTKSPG